MFNQRAMVSSDILPPASSLPIIDLTPFLPSSSQNNNQEAKLATARAINVACTDHGFFYLTGHGVPQKMCDETLEEARKWFLTASKEEKEALRREDVDKGGDGARGYQMIGENVTKGKKDWHEAIDLYRPVKHTSPPYAPCMGPNKWPINPPTYRPLFEKYITAMESLGEAMMRAMSLALDPTTEELFLPSLQAPFWVFRIIGYPPLQQKKTNEGGEDGVSCGEHSDYGCTTFLLADNTKGALQVLAKDGVTWINADPVPGAYVVNIGDMVEVWTNGLWKSTVHRVVHKGENFRVSTPFFYEPDFEARIKPFQVCVEKTGGVSKYPEVRYGDHLVKKVLGNFYSAPLPPPAEATITS